MLKKVISGGQTGVDQAALRAARSVGLETGGTAPKGWATTAGPAPWLADWGLVECGKSGYPARTRKNVADSEGTLWLGDHTSTGGSCTRSAIEWADKPAMFVSAKKAGGRIEMHNLGAIREYIVQTPVPENVALWLAFMEIEVLNVAGNRESSPPSIGEAAERFLVEVFRLATKGA